jgi:hypothetical protein
VTEIARRAARGGVAVRGRAAAAASGGRRPAKAREGGPPRRGRIELCYEYGYSCVT